MYNPRLPGGNVNAVPTEGIPLVLFGGNAGMSYKIESSPIFFGGPPVIRSALATFGLLVIAVRASGQQADSTLLTVQRIYGAAEFRSQAFGPASWLGDGSSYTTLEEADEDGGQNLVRYETERGGREVLVVARQLIPQGDSVPLRIEDYTWSP
ncbi:MAG TPA: hypothetical protein VIV15_10715, partial [Anaerolineales bacterium]